MPPLEPEETIPQRKKSNLWKRKITGIGLKTLTPNKLLTRLPIWLAQTKAVNNLCKLKNEIRQIPYLLHHHDKIGQLINIININQIKNEMEQLLWNIRMETIFINIGNWKTNEPHKFVLNLSQILDLKNSNKQVALQNVSIYYTSNNIRKQYKNNNLKIIAPTWNDEFELPDGFYSVSYIQYYIEYIIKKHETLTAIPLILVYINRINKRLVFEIKN